MDISVFDMFRVGIGPSSSHTVGPLRAAKSFIDSLKEQNKLDATVRIQVRLMGSLAATGRGHGTDRATLLGLMGYTPETIDPDLVEPLITRVIQQKELLLNKERAIEFDLEHDMRFEPYVVPTFHTNAMELSAYADDSMTELLFSRRYYSIGGGFVRAARLDNPELPEDEVEVERAHPLPYPFQNATTLMQYTREEHLTIAEIARANARVDWSDEEIDAKLDGIWEVMKASLDRGFRQTGTMPGPFKIARRAKKMKWALEAQVADPLNVLDWVNAYAIAVAEENASGGQIVTAPTNGAAGVIPAVIAYYLNHVPNSHTEKVRDFLLTAGVVGMIFKKNASISGAEVGCQGEVGVACSMAAAGLTAVMGGSPEQVENAAEIGMEHNLGLTCDPVAGQVQIPCIERNAVAAVKAINAARMALRGDGSHYVSLDQVVQTMLETGRDMQSKYKETSQGGLAIRLVGC